MIGKERQKVAEGENMIQGEFSCCFQNGKNWTTFVIKSEETSEDALELDRSRGGGIEPLCVNCSHEGKMERWLK